MTEYRRAASSCGMVHTMHDYHRLQKFKSGWALCDIGRALAETGRIGRGWA